MPLLLMAWWLKEPVQHQSNTWTNADLLSTGPLEQTSEKSQLKYSGDPL